MAKQLLFYCAHLAADDVPEIISQAEAIPSMVVHHIAPTDPNEKSAKNTKKIGEKSIKQKLILDGNSKDFHSMVAHKVVGTNEHAHEFFASMVAHRLLILSSPTGFKVSGDEIKNEIASMAADIATIISESEDDESKNDILSEKVKQLLEYCTYSDQDSEDESDDDSSSMVIHQIKSGMSEFIISRASMSSGRGSMSSRGSLSTSRGSPKIFRQSSTDSDAEPSTWTLVDTDYESDIDTTETVFVDSDDENESDVIQEIEKGEIEQQMHDHSLSMVAHQVTEHPIQEEDSAFITSMVSHCLKMLADGSGYQIPDEVRKEIVAMASAIVKYNKEDKPDQEKGEDLTQMANQLVLYCAYWSKEDEPAGNVSTTDSLSSMVAHKTRSTPSVIIEDTCESPTPKDNNLEYEVEVFFDAEEKIDNDNIDNVNILTNQKHLLSMVAHKVLGKEITSEIELSEFISSMVAHRLASLSTDTSYTISDDEMKKEIINIASLIASLKKENNFLTGNNNEEIKKLEQELILYCAYLENDQFKLEDSENLSDSLTSMVVHKLMSLPNRELSPARESSECNELTTHKQIEEKNDDIFFDAQEEQINKDDVIEMHKASSRRSESPRQKFHLSRSESPRDKFYLSMVAHQVLYCDVFDEEELVDFITSMVSHRLTSLETESRCKISDEEARKEIISIASLICSLKDTGDQSDEKKKEINELENHLVSYCSFWSNQNDEVLENEKENQCQECLRFDIAIASMNLESEQSCNIDQVRELKEVREETFEDGHSTKFKNKDGLGKKMNFLSKHKHFLSMVAHQVIPPDSCIETELSEFITSLVAHHSSPLGLDSKFKITDEEAEKEIVSMLSLLSSLQAKEKTDEIQNEMKTLEKQLISYCTFWCNQNNETTEIVEKPLCDECATFNSQLSEEHKNEHEQSTESIVGPKLECENVKDLLKCETQEEQYDKTSKQDKRDDFVSRHKYFLSMVAHQVMTHQADVETNLTQFITSMISHYFSTPDLESMFKISDAEAEDEIISLVTRINLLSQTHDQSEETKHQIKALEKELILYCAYWSKQNQELFQESETEDECQECSRLQSMGNIALDDNAEYIHDLVCSKDVKSDNLGSNTEPSEPNTEPSEPNTEPCEENVEQRRSFLSKHKHFISMVAHQVLSHEMCIENELAEFITSLVSHRLSSPVSTSGFNISDKEAEKEIISMLSLINSLKECEDESGSSQSEIKELEKQLISYCAYLLKHDNDITEGEDNIECAECELFGASIKSVEESESRKSSMTELTMKEHLSDVLAEEPVEIIQEENRRSKRNSFTFKHKYFLSMVAHQVTSYKDDIETEFAEFITSLVSHRYSSFNSEMGFKIEEKDAEKEIISLLALINNLKESEDKSIENENKIRNLEKQLVLYCAFWSKQYEETETEIEIGDECQECLKFNTNASNARLQSDFNIIPNAEKYNSMKDRKHTSEDNSVKGNKPTTDNISAKSKTFHISQSKPKFFLSMVAHQVLAHDMCIETELAEFITSLISHRLSSLDIEPSFKISDKEAEKEIISMLSSINILEESKDQSEGTENELKELKKQLVSYCSFISQNQDESEKGEEDECLECLKFKSEVNTETENGQNRIEEKLNTLCTKEEDITETVAEDIIATEAEDIIAPESVVTSKRNSFTSKHQYFLSMVAHQVKSYENCTESEFAEFITTLVSHRLSSFNMDSGFKIKDVDAEKEIISMLSLINQLKDSSDQSEDCQNKIKQLEKQLLLYCSFWCKQNNETNQQTESEEGCQECLRFKSAADSVYLEDSETHIADLKTETIRIDNVELDLPETENTIEDNCRHTDISMSDCFLSKHQYFLSMVAHQVIAQEKCIDTELAQFITSLVSHCLSSLNVESGFKISDKEAEKEIMSMLSLIMKLKECEDQSEEKQNEIKELEKQLIAYCSFWSNQEDSVEEEQDHVSCTECSSFEANNTSLDIEDSNKKSSLDSNFVKDEFKEDLNRILKEENSDILKEAKVSSKRSSFTSNSKYFLSMVAHQVVSYENCTETEFAEFITSLVSHRLCSLSSDTGFKIEDKDAEKEILSMLSLINNLKDINDQSEEFQNRIKDLEKQLILYCAFWFKQSSEINQETDIEDECQECLRFKSNLSNNDILSFDDLEKYPVVKEKESPSKCVHGEIARRTSFLSKHEHFLSMVAHQVVSQENFIEPELSEFITSLVSHRLSILNIESEFKISDKDAEKEIMDMLSLINKLKECDDQSEDKQKEIKELEKQLISYCAFWSKQDDEITEAEESPQCNECYSFILRNDSSQVEQSSLKSSLESDHSGSWKSSMESVIMKEIIKEDLNKMFGECSDISSKSDSFVLKHKYFLSMVAHQVAPYEDCSETEFAEFITSLVSHRISSSNLDPGFKIEDSDAEKEIISMLSLINNLKDSNDQSEECHNKIKTLEQQLILYCAFWSQQNDEDINQDVESEGQCQECLKFKSTANTADDSKYTTDMENESSETENIPKAKCFHGEISKRSSFLTKHKHFLSMVAHQVLAQDECIETELTQFITSLVSHRLFHPDEESQFKISDIEAEKEIKSILSQIAKLRECDEMSTDKQNEIKALEKQLISYCAFWSKQDEESDDTEASSICSECMSFQSEILLPDDEDIQLNFSTDLLPAEEHLKDEPILHKNNSFESKESPLHSKSNSFISKHKQLLSMVAHQVVSYKNQDETEYTEFISSLVSHRLSSLNSEQQFKIKEEDAEKEIISMLALINNLKNSDNDSEENKENISNLEKQLILYCAFLSDQYDDIEEEFDRQYNCLECSLFNSAAQRVTDDQQTSLAQKVTSNQQESLAEHSDIKQVKSELQIEYGNKVLKKRSSFLSKHKPFLSMVAHQVLSHDASIEAELGEFISSLVSHRISSFNIGMAFKVSDKEAEKEIISMLSVISKLKESDNQSEEKQNEIKRLEQQLVSYCKFWSEQSEETEETELEKADECTACVEFRSSLVSLNASDSHNLAKSTIESIDTGSTQNEEKQQTIEKIQEKTENDKIRQEQIKYENLLSMVAHYAVPQDSLANMDIAQFITSMVAHRVSELNVNTAFKVQDTEVRKEIVSMVSVIANLLEAEDRSDECKRKDLESMLNQLIIYCTYWIKQKDEVLEPTNMSDSLFSMLVHQLIPGTVNNLTSIDIGLHDITMEPTADAEKQVQINFLANIKDIRESESFKMACHKNLISMVSHFVASEDSFLETDFAEFVTSMVSHRLTCLAAGSGYIVPDEEIKKEIASLASLITHLRQDNSHFTDEERSQELTKLEEELVKYCEYCSQNNEENIESISEPLCTMVCHQPNQAILGSSVSEVNIEEIQTCQPDFSTNDESACNITIPVDDDLTISPPFLQDESQENMELNSPFPVVKENLVSLPSIEDDKAELISSIVLNESNTISSYEYQEEMTDNVSPVAHIKDYPIPSPSYQEVSEHISHIAHGNEYPIPSHSSQEDEYQEVLETCTVNPDLFHSMVAHRVVAELPSMETELAEFLASMVSHRLSSLNSSSQYNIPDQEAKREILSMLQQIQDFQLNNGNTSSKEFAMMVNQLILYCSYWKKDEISECSDSSDHSIASMIAHQLASSTPDSPSFSLTIPLDDENGMVTCLECFIDKDMFTNDDIYEDSTKSQSIDPDNIILSNDDSFVENTSGNEQDETVLSSLIEERMSDFTEQSMGTINKKNVHKNRQKIDTQLDIFEERNVNSAICSKLDYEENDFEDKDIVKLSEELSKITQDSISIVTEITKDLEALSADIYLEDKKAMDELMKDTPEEARRQIKATTLNEDTPKENKKQMESDYTMLEDTPEETRRQIQEEFTLLEETPKEIRRQAEVETSNENTQINKGKQLTPEKPIIEDTPEESRKLKQDDFALLEETPKEIRKQTEANVLNEDTPKDNRKQMETECPLLGDTPEEIRKIPHDKFAFQEEATKDTQIQTEKDLNEANQKQIEIDVAQIKITENINTVQNEETVTTLFKQSQSTIKEVNIENEIEKAELIAQKIVEPKQATTSVVAHKLSVGCCEEIATMVDTIKQEIANFRGFEEDDQDFGICDECPIIHETHKVDTCEEKSMQVVKDCNSSQMKKLSISTDSEEEEVEDEQVIHASITIGTNKPIIVQTAFPNSGTTIVTRATNSTTQVTTKEMSTHLQNVSSLTQCKPPVGFADYADYEPINYELRKKFKTVKNTKENLRPRSISRQSRPDELDVRSRTPMRASGSVSRLSRLEDLDLRSIRSTSRNPEDDMKSKKDEKAETKKKDATLKKEKETKKKEDKESKKKEEKSKPKKKIFCKTEPAQIRTPVYSSMASIATNPDKSVIQYLFGCFRFKFTTYSKEPKDKNTK